MSTNKDPISVKVEELFDLFTPKNEFEFETLANLCEVTNADIEKIDITLMPDVYLLYIYKDYQCDSMRDELIERAQSRELKDPNY